MTLAGGTETGVPSHRLRTAVLVKLDHLFQVCTGISHELVIFEDLGELLGLQFLDQVFKAGVALEKQRISIVDFLDFFILYSAMMRLTVA
jgi:hypothetical protein